MLFEKFLRFFFPNFLLRRKQQGQEKDNTATIKQLAEYDR